VLCIFKLLLDSYHLHYYVRFCTTVERNPVSFADLCFREYTQQAFILDIIALHCNSSRNTSAVRKMWKTQSETSFRIKGLPFDETKDRLDKTLVQLVQNDCELAGIAKSFKRRRSWTPRTSLATQGSSHWSTVSTPSKSHKQRIMKLASRHEDWTHTDIGDSFSGITVLHSPANALIE